MKKVLLALIAFGMTTAVAHAVPLNGKKGIGYAESIGGANGIAFNYGTGNLIIEGMLGLSRSTPKDVDGAGMNTGIGLGVHFQALRAEKAVWTVGGRVNIGMNSPVTPKGADAPDSSTQFGLDIPTRVYWFPNKHVSLHVETGISIYNTPKEGDVFGRGKAGPEGSDIVFFDTSSSIGMTFWW